MATLLGKSMSTMFYYITEEQRMILQAGSVKADLQKHHWEHCQGRLLMLVVLLEV